MATYDEYPAVGTLLRPMAGSPMAFTGANAGYAPARSQEPESAAASMPASRSYEARMTDWAGRSRAAAEAQYGAAPNAPAPGSLPAGANYADSADNAREMAKMRSGGIGGIGGADQPTMNANALANYRDYKGREAAARAAALQQPAGYPGGVNMTNAAYSDGGEGDSFAAAQRKIDTARAGGAGWLGLFTSGGAQKQLNAMRQRQIELGKLGIARGHLGVEQGRLGFDVGKFWEGENPLAQRKQYLDEQIHNPTIAREWALNDLFGSNRIEDLRDVAGAFKGEPGVTVVPGYGTTTYGATRGFRSPTPKTISTLPMDPKEAAAAQAEQARRERLGMPSAYQPTVR